MEYSNMEECTCPGCLSWDSFDNIYIDFAMEYSQQILTSTLSRETLSHFPANMPTHIMIPIIAKKHQVLHDEMQRRGIEPDDSISNESEDDFFRDAAKTVLTPVQEYIQYAFEGVYAIARFGKKIPEMEYPDFERILISQNIIVICSFAEGFFANTIRFLCGVQSKPNTV